MNNETIANSLKSPVKTNGPKTILVVEDHEEVSDLIVLSLYRLGHTRVEVASSGKKALELAALTRPDLIIMDINMPEMDGIETAQKLALFHPCPVIFSTGLWDKDTLRRSREIPMSYYLVKPFSPAQLKAAIHFVD